MITHTEIFPPQPKKYWCSPYFLKRCTHAHITAKDKIKCAAKRRNASGGCWKYHEGFCPKLLSIDVSDTIKRIVSGVKFTPPSGNVFRMRRYEEKE